MTDMDVTPQASEEVDVGVETPEADAVEQAQGSEAAETPRDVVTIPDEVNEADALEQAYEVEIDDDYRG